MCINVAIADDHFIVRQGLNSLLSNIKDINVIGEADNGHSIIEIVEKKNPDIVVMDIAMPGMNGIEATKKIINRFGKTIKIVALSVHADPEFVKKMLQAGASAYILKGDAFEDLHKAISCVYNDGIYISSKITKVIMGDYLNPEIRSKNKSDILSSREREILQLITEGYSSKDISLKLSISSLTVDTHRKKIMNKLELRSIPELTKYAIRQGITFLN